MTLCLAALVRRVTELRDADLWVCHYAEDFTRQWIRPLGCWEKLPYECPRLANPSREPADGRSSVLLSIADDMLL
jgi:hypothetical protein